MAEQRVIIEHEDGRRYSVTPAVFRDQYEPQGFRVVSYEDGVIKYQGADGKPSGSVPFDGEA